MRFPGLVGVVAVVLGWFTAVAALGEEERPLFLPFDVTLGGQKARMETGNELFAQVDQPVKANAKLEIEEKAPMLIINAFPCGEDGTVEVGQPAGVIFARDTSEVALDATMDEVPLKPGTYLANIVAHGKTSRLLFTVGEPKIKVEFSKVLDFLKKKAGVE